MGGSEGLPEPLILAHAHADEGGDADEPKDGTKNEDEEHRRWRRDFVGFFVLSPSLGS